MFNRCLGMLRNASFLLVVCSTALHADPLASKLVLQKLEQQCLQARTTEQCLAAQTACRQLEDAVQTQPASIERDLDLAKLWNGRVDCEVQLGHFAAAEQYGRRALDMRVKHLGSDHVDVVASLNNVGGVCFSQGRYDEAESLLRQALALQQKRLGPNHPDMTLSLNNFAALLKRRGRYAEGEALVRQALALSQTIWGGDHHRIALSLHNLAAMLHSQGKFAEAETTYRQALAMRQRLHGPDHVSVADTISQLASALEGQGKYGEAERSYQAALAMRQKLLAPEHTQVAEILNNLAGVYFKQGRYADAEQRFRQALVLQQKTFGNEHPEVATCLQNLATVLLKQAKYGEAEGLFTQALAIQQKVLGPEHPSVATTLNNLAVVLKNQGKHEQAEAQYLRVLAMQRKLLGNEHPDVATTLHNLASTLRGLRKYAPAEALYRESLGLRQKLLGSEHPEVANTLSNLAVVLAAQAKYDEAETVARRGVAIRQAQLGPEHPDIAVSLHNLGHLALCRSQLASSVALLREAARVREGQIRATVSETRMQALLASLRDPDELAYGLLLSVAPLPQMRQLAMTLALLRKGRVAEAGAQANRLLRDVQDVPMVKQRHDEWQAVRRQRESLLYGGIGKRKPTEYQEQLKQLQLQSDSLEAQLAQAIPNIRSFQPPSFDQVIAAVADRIPANAVLVEMVWTRRYQCRAQDMPERWDPAHLIALLLFPDRRIVSVDLGPAAKLDELGHSLLSSLRTTSSAPAAAAQALYRQVAAPLLPHIEGRTDIYLSLDGSLNLIPFDALHDGTDYLLGRYRFHYLTSGRDLLRQPSLRPPGRPLILANPDVGHADVATDGEPQSIYQRLAALTPLPAAQWEAQQIAALIGTSPLLGSNAREESVREAHAPWFLHLATHGLFLTDNELPTPPDSRSSLLLPAQSSPASASPATEREVEKLPGEAGAMNRSALVLADVLQRQRDGGPQRDGLLTAQEVRSLDLDGTQLVVLSACETGRGTLSAGQGVYGLRRAFLVAGAETVVSSLWRVHDAATGSLMTKYYRKLLDKQAPGDRVSAMVESMQELRKEPGRAHPHYWAPFLVIGQGGPLRWPSAQNTGPN